MNFVIDHLWLVAPSTLVVGVLIGWLAVRSSRPPVLAGGFVVILLGLGMMTWDFLTESPFEQIRTTLDEIISAAERGDPEGICQRIGSTYQDGFRDQAGIRSLIRARIGEADVEDVSLAGVEMARQGEDIEVSYVAHVQGRQTRGAGGLPTGRYPVRLRMLFRREGEEWRVVAVRRFDIIQSAKEIPLDSLR
jgi:hypothetical protein